MAKLMMIIFLAAGIWIGMQAEQFLMKDQCLDAGGAVAENGLCVGVQGS